VELAVHRARLKRPRVQGIDLDQKVLRSPTETPWIGTAQEVQGGVLQNRTLGYPGLDPEKREATDTRYRRLFRGGPAGAFEATLSGRITDANGALATMLGYQSRTELLERSVTDLIVDSPIPGQVLERLWEEEKILSAEVRLRTSQGDEVVGLLSTSILEAEDDDEGLITGTVMDITGRKRIEADLERLAFEDPLTGLANRRAVEDHAEKYLALAERRGTRLGLIYLDLARFKEINDHHGHPAGDKVLVEVARRLEAAARDGDVVGRVGGDEFLVLLPDVAGPDAVLTVARRMDRELTGTPIDLGSDEELTVRAEMGVSLFPDHGPHLEDLIRAADEAMYQVKEGRGEDEDRPSVTIAEPPTGEEPEGDR
jgi:diguanylate cyclase (GGDEF)-like protein/PAS domain S-box-containing protein